MSEIREGIAMQTILTTASEVLSPSITSMPQVSPTTTTTSGTMTWIAAPVVVSAAAVGLLVLFIACLVIRRANKSRVRVYCQPQGDHSTINNNTNSEAENISQNGDVSELLHGIVSTPSPPLEVTSNWTYDSVEDLSLTNQYASQGEHDIFVVRESPHYPRYSRLGGPVLNPNIRRKDPSSRGADKRIYTTK